MLKLSGRILVRWLVALPVLATLGVPIGLAQTTAPRGASPVSKPSNWEALNAACTDALKRADYVQAERKCGEGAVDAERNGANDLRLTSSLFNLGEALRGQKKFANAEAFYLRAVLLQQKLIGADRPEIALSLVRLGEAYNAQRKYAAAEPQVRRALAIFEKSTGTNHPELAGGFENLAIALNGLGRKKEATEAELRAQILRKQK